MRKSNLKIPAAVCVFMITFSLTADAETHYVSPGQSIQTAINAAANGDEIEVSPGTYNEAINFNGKAVRLYSSGGSGVTTINGTGHYHVVQCVSGEDANTILEGFTITGGNANGPEWLDRHGGGMLNGGSNPTIIGCVFCGNYTGDGSNGLFEGGPGGDGGDGAGMCNSTASPTLTECTFSHNVTGKGGQGDVGVNVDGSNGGKSGSGAGISNTGGSSPTVRECKFTENKCGNGGNGGIGSSLYALPFTETKLYAGDGGNGGDGGQGAGMYNSGSSPIVTECTFTGNQGGSGGSGGQGWGHGFRRRCEPLDVAPFIQRRGGNALGCAADHCREYLAGRGSGGRVQGNALGGNGPHHGDRIRGDTSVGEGETRWQ